MRNKRKVVLASLLAGVFVVQQSMMLSVVAASNITGVTNGGSGTFDITPTTRHGSTGFRAYENFNLGAGDTANMNMGALNSFVNLVGGTNPVTINGILNSVQNGNVGAGNVTFISPNGLVVGSQGIVNVGSFANYTPIQSHFDPAYNVVNNAALGSELAENPLVVTVDGRSVSLIAKKENSNYEYPTPGNGNIEINGNILSRGEAILHGAKVTIADNAGVYANANVANGGVDSTLFNALVNTNGISGFSTNPTYATNKNGDLVIVAGNGIDFKGNAINFAKGTDSITLVHNLPQAQNDLNVSGNVGANAGKLNISNNAKNLIISGNVLNNNGNTNIHNDGNLLSSSDSKLQITGKITTNGAKTSILNYGNKGLDTTGAKITHSNGDLYITNGVDSDSVYANRVTNTASAKVGGNIKVTNGNLNVTNNVTGVNGMDYTATVDVDNGNATVINYGAGQMYINSASDVSGKGTYKNYGAGGMLQEDPGNELASHGGLEIYNNGAGGMTLNGFTSNEGAAATVTNDAGDLNVGGKFMNNADATFTNNARAGAFNVNAGADIDNTTGVLTMNNYGTGGFTTYADSDITSQGLDMLNQSAGNKGMTLGGKVTNDGVANVTNKTGEMLISGDFNNRFKDDNRGKATFLNDGTKLTIAQSGSVYVNKSDLKMTNNGAGGFVVDGQIFGPETSTAELINNGANGLTVSKTGTVNIDGNLSMKNTGANGILIDVNQANNALYNVRSNNNTTIDSTAGNVVIKGKVEAKNGNATIKAKNGSVKLGDDKTNNNVKAGRNINITVTDGNIENYAQDLGRTAIVHVKDGAKTFLVADGDLTMDVTRGTIGKDMPDGYCAGGNCAGISNEGTSRDFNKSINGNIKGKVNATTTKAVTKPDDNYVINYAAIDSDMNIDHIQADGRVILTADYGKDGTARYSMKNVATNPAKANVEGYGLSLIASDKIGTADKKLTFNQTKAGTLRTARNDDGNGNGVTGGKYQVVDGYGMDVLANGDINIKALDDDKNPVNNVCTMISREGSIDAEFAGNTYIDEITAKKDVKVVTRGRTAEINHLGYVPSLGDEKVDGNFKYGDNVYSKHNGTYLGNSDRYVDDGPVGDNDGLGYDHATPNSLEFKALDINSNTRVVDEKHPDKNYTDPTTGKTNHHGTADSIAVVRDGIVEPDTGNVDITADNIFANGVEADFNVDGFNKQPNDSTDKIVGPEGVDNIPTGHAVRPDDVDQTGRDNTERNYYYPDGDGDDKFDNTPSHVDDDDNIVDDTPLEIPDKPGPEPDPNPNPNPNPNNPDPKLLYKKLDTNNVQAIDKRQYMRFNVSDNKNPVTMEKSNNGIDGLIDVSRGGIAVKHNNALKVGDVIPVHLTYGDLDIKTDVKVVSATSSRAGAEFINLNKATANKLLFLSILLEDHNRISMY